MTVFLSLGAVLTPRTQWCGLWQHHVTSLFWAMFQFLDLMLKEVHNPQNIKPLSKRDSSPEHWKAPLEEMRAQVQQSPVPFQLYIPLFWHCCVKK